jgi:pantothenate kinase
MPFDDLISRIEALHSASPDRRIIVGIAGSPGGGKTTLASGLVEQLNRTSAGQAIALPMDGYHLANSTLSRLGLRDRKGALETFDGWGFVALLKRLRTELGHTIFAPSFERTVDDR